VFERVTDDRFVIVLKQRDASFDVRRAHKLFEKHGAVSVIEGDRFV
jgi:hypothetical protein